MSFTIDTGNEIPNFPSSSSASLDSQSGTSIDNQKVNNINTDNTISSNQDSEHPISPHSIESQIKDGVKIDSSKLAAFVFGRADPARHKPTAYPNFLEALKELPYESFRPSINPSTTIPRQKLPVIAITDAQNSSDSSTSSSYIAYTIRTEIPTHGINWEAHRRYSDFESLRKLLTRLYPTCIVPPIPEKHSVAAYASKAGKAKKDPKIIDKRKRTLQTFLNRLAVHPFFREEPVFHSFLEGSKSWSDILSNSGLANYLWKKDSSSTETGVKGKDKGELKNPIAEFTIQEELANHFMNQFSVILKIHNSIIRHNTDVCKLNGDLAAAYNGWSLTEEGLNFALESVGQALETMVGVTAFLSQNLESSFGDIVGEYYQFEKAVNKLLKWRHKKQSEYEIIDETLKVKNAYLSKLEATENDSQRQQDILNRNVANITGNNFDNNEGGVGEEDDNDPFPRRRRAASFGGGNGNNAAYNIRPPTGVASVLGNGGDALRSVISSFIDTDSASARRNNILKTREKIASLNKQQQVVNVELEVSNKEITKALENFQQDKLKDLRSMVLTFAMCFRDYHRKSVKVWRDAKAEVDRIEN